MRLAWFSPLPPLESGIADYSFDLLPLVARAPGVESVDVYSSKPGGFRRLHRPPGVRVLSPASYDARAREYDAVLYHLGNNPFHRDVYEAALRHPGIAVFHDYLLHHLIAWMYVEHGRDPMAYRRLLVEDYGATGERLAELRLREVNTEFEKFLFPLNGHMARRARAIIVHSEDVADRMREVAPNVTVTVIPHHAGWPPREVQGVDRARARSMLGLSEDAFLVGQFGYITRPKQPHAVVEGFAKLAAAREDAVLLMVGADRTGGGLARLIRRYGLDGRVRLAGFVELVPFYLHLKAVDVVVNLRYPSAGESSGTFCRAMAEGRPVIVNDLGSFAEVPDDVALKVEVDGPQGQEVGEHLLRLAADPELRLGFERRAREYAATVLHPDRCARMYVEVARLTAAVAATR